MAKEKESVFLMMVHKDFEDREPARVTRTSFNKVWKDKGWKEVSEATSAVSSNANAGADKPAK